MTKKRGRKVKKRSTWKSRKTIHSNQQEIKKQSSEDLNTNRLRIGEIGTTGLAAVQDYIDLVMPYELSSYENRMRSFDKMALNSAVATALDFNYITIEKAFGKFTVVPSDERNPESVEIAKFVDYNFRNMRQTLRQVVRNAVTFKKYGFSVIEKGYERITSGEYSGTYNYKIRNLATRPQQSLDRSKPFEYDVNGRSILYARQNSQYFRDNDGFSSNASFSSTYLDIPRNKFMLFGYNTTDTNPFGESPLVGCFRDVKEMDLITEYETVGVTRDMGGMLVFGVPSEILNKAAADVNSPEARSLERLEEQGALCHAGEQTSMIIPRELLEGSTTAQAYDMKLTGVEGGGKMYNTSDIIRAKQKAILDRFGAGHLILGEGGGSYALIEGKNSIHAHYVERDIRVIEEVINEDLIPQLLSLNGINIPEDMMPKLRAGNVEPVSLDESGKFLQRLGSVGLLPKYDVSFLNELYAKSEYDYRIPEGTTREQLELLLSEDSSRAGEGQGTSGTGNSQLTTGGDLNTENA